MMFKMNNKEFPNVYKKSKNCYYKLLPNMEWLKIDLLFEEAESYSKKFDIYEYNGFFSFRRIQEDIYLAYRGTNIAKKTIKDKTPFLSVVEDTLKGIVDSELVEFRDELLKLYQHLIWDQSRNNTIMLVGYGYQLKSDVERNIAKARGVFEENPEINKKLLDKNDFDQNLKIKTFLNVPGNYLRICNEQKWNITKSGVVIKLRNINGTHGFEGIETLAYFEYPIVVEYLSKINLFNYKGKFNFTLCQQKIKLNYIDILIAEQEIDYYNGMDSFAIKCLRELRGDKISEIAFQYKIKNFSSDIEEFKIYLLASEFETETFLRDKRSNTIRLLNKEENNG